MHLYCPQPRARLFLAIADTKRQLHVYCRNDAGIGIDLAVKARVPINDQIAEVVSAIIGPSYLAKHLEIDQGFCDAITGEGEALGFYLARYEPHPEGFNWAMTKTIPQILASLEKNRLRLPYIRAFQRLMGADQGIIRAVERDLKKD